MDIDGNIARKNSKGKFELKIDPAKPQPVDDRPCEGPTESEPKPFDVLAKNNAPMNRTSGPLNRNGIFKSSPVKFPYP